MTEAVCVRPQSGRLFATAAVMDEADSELDQDERTIENNPALRLEAYREFQRQMKEMKNKNDISQFKRIVNSQRIYRSRTRLPHKEKKDLRSEERLKDSNMALYCT